MRQLYLENNKVSVKESELPQIFNKMKCIQNQLNSSIEIGYMLLANFEDVCEK